MKTLQLYFLLTICFLINSCGIISSTRYGNGLKLNIGENWGREKDDDEKVVKKTNRIYSSQITNDLPKFDSVNNSESLTTLADLAPKEVNKLFEESITLSPDKNKLKSPEVKLVHNPKITNRKALISNINNKESPMETNAIIAGILFYGGLILMLTLHLMGFEILGIFALIPFIGFIFALISKSVIKRSSYYYSGNGLVTSIIFLTVIFLFVAFFLFLALVAFFL